MSVYSETFAEMKHALSSYKTKRSEVQIHIDRLRSLADEKPLESSEAIRLRAMADAWESEKSHDDS